MLAWMKRRGATLMFAVGIAAAPYTIGPYPLTPYAGAADVPSPDQQLQADVKQQLQMHVPKAELVKRVEISVHAGVVELAGDVPSYADRMWAERLSRRVPGISDVKNRLQVKPDLGAQDDVLSAVQKRLAADALIRICRLDVAEDNGVVTLTGSVPTATERRRAVAAARQVRGVTEVRNEIRVAHATDGNQLPATSDQIIQNLNRILGNASPWMEQGLEFDFQDGLVRVQGSIPSVTQKNFLRELLHAVPGVTSIDLRELRISPAVKPSPLEFVEATSPAATQQTVQMVVDAARLPSTPAIEVRLRDHTLVLAGEVASVAQQLRLMQLAKVFSRGMRIEDELQVIPPQRDDATMHSELVGVLASDTVLSQASIAATVENGTATLSGSVADFNTKIRALRLAARVPGLSAVDNQIRVQWSSQVSDDGLKRTVHKQLQQQWGPAAQRWQVDVHDGVVTLQTSDTPDELAQQVLALVASVDCVRDVRLAATP